MIDAISLCIDAAHPSLSGHFPGEPIVPGAVLLDHAISHVERMLGRRVTMVSSAKFLAPVRPQQSVILNVRHSANDMVAVTALVERETVFSLLLTLEAAGPR